jgi:hypothetical protein
MLSVGLLVYVHVLLIERREVVKGRVQVFDPMAVNFVYVVLSPSVHWMKYANPSEGTYTHD